MTLMLSTPSLTTLATCCIMTTSASSSVVFRSSRRHLPPRVSSSDHHDDICLLLCRRQIITTPLQPSMNLRRGRFLTCNDEPVVGRPSLLNYRDQMMTNYFSQRNRLFSVAVRTTFWGGSGMCKISLWRLLAC